MAYITGIYETIQGEGLSAGTPCVRVDFAGCNLKCGGSNLLESLQGVSDGATWRCDTAEAWREGCWKDTQEVAQRALEMLKGKSSAYMILLSGGEPMQQSVAVEEICSAITQHPYIVEIDTNGAILPGPDLLDNENLWFNVSIKLSTSGNPKDARLKPEVIYEFANHQRVSFKFTIGSRSDVKEAMEICQNYGIDAMRTIFLPTGERLLDESVNARQVARWALESGVLFSRRMHLLLEGEL